MNTNTPSLSPWHRASFDAFIQDRLPRLLAQRLPLVGYSAEPSWPYACRLRVVLRAKPADLVLVMPQVPQPDADGAFEIEGRRYVCVPKASCPELDRAQIRCVGEQLYDLIESRLGEAPRDLEWDMDMARSWLPIDAWITQFVLGQPAQDGWVQIFGHPHPPNQLAAMEHLRRIAMDPGDDVVSAGQLGRICPVLSPEGTNIGRIRSVARGATIRDGRIVVLDDRPEMTLSLNASCIPFLEHSDTMRLLMGGNMMHQWVEPEANDREPPLVQTGVDGEGPVGRLPWGGRNLLTAFTSLGGNTHEDAIVVSQSAAQRLGMGGPLEPGDKLSNRHGSKGVISRILPDQRMPQLPDGTPVELVFCFIGLLTRLNVGQLREAVAGRIARAEGQPVIAPPFAAPSSQELRQRLTKAGMDPSGMERLAREKGGPVMPYPTTVGWVYWGKTHHLSGEKIYATGGNERGGQRQNDLEYLTLRDLGATAIIAEEANLRDAEHPDAGTLAARVASGQPLTAAPPTPVFANLTRRLAAGGVRAELDKSELKFRFEPPTGDTLELAQPVPHPWLPDHMLGSVGLLNLSEPLVFLDGPPSASRLPLRNKPECVAMQEANARLGRMLAEQAPPGILGSAKEQLEQAVQDYFRVLLGPKYVRLTNRVLFSGRAVLAPGPELRLDQLGLADENAWILFGPLAQRQVGAQAVAARTPAAAAALDAVMNESWIILWRAPTLFPTSMLAFHPVRIPERVIRLHPMACMFLAADFDGDQGGLLLPLTPEAQKEAGSKLSIAAHLRRDPSLLGWLLPPHAALWGLAHLSLTPAGLKQISRIAGMAVSAPAKFITRSTLEAAARAILNREGVDRALDVLQQWTTLGFAHAAASGASLSPFAGADLHLPPQPGTDAPAVWQAYTQEIAASIARLDRFNDPDLGPQLLAVLSGARGNLSHLAALLGSRGVQPSVEGSPVIFRHGWMQGLTPDEFFASAAHGRRMLRQIIDDQEMRSAYGVAEPRRSNALTVIARAMRSANPGIVLARAAATGESDPLTDLDTRLFIGLPA